MLFNSTKFVFTFYSKYFPLSQFKRRLLTALICVMHYKMQSKQAYMPLSEVLYAVHTCSYVLYYVCKFYVIQLGNIDPLIKDYNCLQLIQQRYQNIQQAQFSIQINSYTPNNQSSSISESEKPDYDNEFVGGTGKLCSLLIQKVVIEIK